MENNTSRKYRLNLSIFLLPFGEIKRREMEQQAELRRKNKGHCTLMEMIQ